MFKSRGDIVYKCTVRLLEDPEILECEFHPSYKGKYLLEHVCQQLNLTETDYFGLRYVDGNGQRHWLHLAKLILKQVKDASPILFSFRVKFYPPNPLLLKEDATRFQIYLQLKRDLAHGRLFCTPNEAAMLGALTIQIELGDYDPSIHMGNYVTEMRLLVRQTDTIEARIQELHREPVEGTPGGSGGVKGMSTQEAERTFLKIGCQLDTYGVDPHPVKDHRGNQLYLGINHSGILTFQGVRKTNHFKWNEVHKINFEGRMFIVHLNYPEKKHTVGFKCPNGAACRHVWCCAIEQMLFFTLPSSSDACVYTGGGLFSWGTKFKYFGRTEREILERDGLLAPRDAPGSAGGKRKASSVPATPSTPMTGDFGYSSLPRSTHSAPLDDGGISGECNGGCLLSGPAVDIALACCDPLRALPEEPKRTDTASMDPVDSSVDERDRSVNIVDSSGDESDSSVTIVDSSVDERDRGVIVVDSCVDERDRGVIVVDSCVDERDRGVIVVDSSVDERDRGVIIVDTSDDENDSSVIIVDNTGVEKDRSVNIVDSFVNESDRSATIVDSSGYETDGTVTIVNDSVTQEYSSEGESDRIVTIVDSSGDESDRSVIIVGENDRSVTIVDSSVEENDRVLTIVDSSGDENDKSGTHVDENDCKATKLDDSVTHGTVTHVNGSMTHVDKTTQVDDTKVQVDSSFNIDATVHNVNRTADVFSTVTDVNATDAIDSKTRKDNLATACTVPEYSLRDSFEHSSSESGVTSHTHGAEEWRTPPPALQPPPRPFSLLRAFVPSFIFVWVSLALLSLLVFETDWVIFQTLKRKPEIVSLRRHYYVPLKEYLKRTIVELF